MEQAPLINDAAWDRFNKQVGFRGNEQVFVATTGRPRPGAARRRLKSCLAAKVDYEPFLRDLRRCVPEFYGEAHGAVGERSPPQSVRCKEHGI